MTKTEQLLVRLLQAASGGFKSIATYSECEPTKAMAKRMHKNIQDAISAADEAFSPHLENRPSTEGSNRSEQCE